MSTAPTIYTLASPSKDRNGNTQSRKGRFSSRLSAIFGGGGGSSGESGGGSGRRSIEREKQLKVAASNGNGLAPGDGERYARRQPQSPAQYQQQQQQMQYQQGYYQHQPPSPPFVPSMGNRASRSEIALNESPGGGRPSSVVSFPRLSVASSSKRYEGVIQQERDFVSMRYPTESERQDILRRS